MMSLRCSSMRTAPGKGTHLFWCNFMVNMISLPRQARGQNAGKALKKSAARTYSGVFVTTTGEAPVRQTASFLSFPYVCSEPVLAK